MKAVASAETWWRIALVIGILLSLVILALLPGRMLGEAWWWIWLVVLLCIILAWAFLGSPDEVATRPTPEPRMLEPEARPAAVEAVMDVRLATEQQGVEVFRGRLKESPESAYQRLKAETGEFVPLLQEDKELGAAVVLMPKSVEQAAYEHATRPWINWTLLGATLLTTTWAGAAHQGVNLLQEPGRFAVGLPYSLALMAILGIHELGHYVTAKRHGIRVTPPYFIPVPFALGTFGAFIQMKSPTENRRALFDVAIAGPLAGLVIAVPALLIGLQTSEVIPPDTGQTLPAGGTSAGSSVLLALLAKLVLGDALEYGCLLRFSPMAFAGWLGVFITGLNLLPIGQLDGGHMARGMFGSRLGNTISTVAMWSLLLLSLFVWPGLFMWALIVFFIAGRGTPPLNDLTPISAGRRWLGYATFLILLAILAPLPHAFWSGVGIRCPYI